MKTLVLSLAVALFFSFFNVGYCSTRSRQTQQTRSYSMRDNYGRQSRVTVERNTIRQYDRRGYIDKSYRVEGNRINQYDSKGRLK